MRLKTTLEQWQTLREIDQAGSIQAASVAMNKSHTTLIYAVKKLEQQLGVSLVVVQGRRAVLSEDGQSLLRRANAMLEQARELEQMSAQLGQGIESEITIAIDHLCDPAWLYQPMAEFVASHRNTSIQIIETSLSKTTAMVTSEQADLAIINLPITNYPAQAFGITSMLPVITAQHPLASQPTVSLSELANISQIVVRDLGADMATKRKLDVGWLKSNQRITVDNFDHALRAVGHGVGYCRLPAHIVNSPAGKELVILAVENAQCYQVPLHLTLPKGSKTGPAASAFHALLMQRASERMAE